MKKVTGGLTILEEKNATKERKLEQGREPEHQDGDGGGQTTETGRSNCVVEGGEVEIPR